MSLVQEFVQSQAQSAEQFVKDNQESNEEDTQETEKNPDTSPPSRKRIRIEHPMLKADGFSDADHVDLEFGYHLFRTAGLVRKVQIRDEKQDMLVEMQSENEANKAISLLNTCQFGSWENALKVKDTNYIMKEADGQIFDKSSECDEEAAAAAAAAANN